MAPGSIVHRCSPTPQTLVWSYGIKIWNKTKANSNALMCPIRISCSSEREKEAFAFAAFQFYAQRPQTQQTERNENDKTLAGLSGETTRKKVLINIDNASKQQHKKPTQKSVPFVMRSCFLLLFLFFSFNINVK